MLVWHLWCRPIVQARVCVRCENSPWLMCVWLMVVGSQILQMPLQYADNMRCLGFKSITLMFSTPCQVCR